MLPEKIELEVVTPQRHVLDEQVESVEMPGKDGYLGILPGHAPLLTELGLGILTYHKGSEVKRLTVLNGYAEVLPDRVTILANDALRPDEIDANRAQQQLDKGHKLWNEAGDSEEAYDHALEVIAEAESKLATAQEKS